jgi:hypothetical protein
LPVDIYLPEFKLIVEYCGEQHYKPYSFSKNYSPRDLFLRFFKQKERDLIKLNLIVANEFNYLIIPYWESISKKNLKKLLREKVIYFEDGRFRNLVERIRLRLR